MCWRKFRLLMLLVILPVLQPGTLAHAAAPYHVGIISSDASQSGDENQGARAMIRTYGEVKDGGMIDLKHYAGDFIGEQQKTVALIAAMAADPLMKAIIVNQAVPGTLEGFRQVRSKRADILLIAIGPHESPQALSKTADLVLRNDFISAGYRVVWSARQLGAKNFVHLSFPRHLKIETINRRRMIMAQACADLGLRFIDETVPDPLDRQGMVVAQQYVHDKVPQWLRKYGQETAFFATNDAQTEPLIRQVIALGGFFIEASLPSPLLGYPAALGMDFKGGMLDFDVVMNRLEEAIIAKGGAGRLGSWAYSSSYAATAGSIQHAINCIEGRSKMTDLRDIFRAFGKFTSGAKWSGSYYMEAPRGEKISNFVLMLQDTYIFGKGYMHATDVDVPKKYFMIPASYPK